MAKKSTSKNGRERNLVTVDFSKEEKDAIEAEGNDQGRTNAGQIRFLLRPFFKSKIPNYA